MTQETFSVIFLEYRITKYEHFLKVTFHGFGAHLKDYFSARVSEMADSWLFWKKTGITLKSFFSMRVMFA